MGTLERLSRFKNVKVMGTLRVAAYFGVVGAVVAAYTTREAKASMSEQGFVIGRDLSKVADLLDHTYEVNLNGQHLYMARNDTLLPLKDILDRYEIVCRDNPGLAAEAWKAIPEEKRKIHGTGDFKGLIADMGIVRKDSEHEGMVACLAGGSPNEGSDVQDGLKKFLRTGELSHIGKLRYVYVAGPNESGHWMVTTMWTEDSFNIQHIMLPEGTDDAPGTDSPTVGRPPAAQRIFTATITGTPYGTRMYQTNVTPENIYAKFDATMTSDGWMLFTTKDAPHIYYKDGVQTMVIADRDALTSKTTVSINELGGEQLRTTH